MKVSRALRMMRTDLGRPVKLIKSARLPYEVLVVEAEGKMPLPEGEGVLHEVRITVFIGEHRAGSMIVDSEITRS